MRTRARIAIASVVVLVLAAGIALAARGDHPAKTVRAAGRSATTSAPDEPQAGDPAAEPSTTGLSTPPSSSAGVSGGATSRQTVVATVAPKPTTAPPTSTATTGNLQNDSVGIVVITEADNGKSYTLHRNSQGIQVQLSNGEMWTEPQSSNGTVLPRRSGSTNSDGSAQALFVAGADGQATITAQGQSHPQPCQTAQPRCLMPDHIMEFQVNVAVVG
jgi:hypothetical protein